MTNKPNKEASVSGVDIQFNSKQELENWVIVNDTVMGGRSRTNLSIEDNCLSFAGILSLENNGGFASIRRVYDPKNWKSKKALHIRVKGDGRAYQLRLRTNLRVDGVAYVVSFQTQMGEVTTHSFESSEFVPQFRGRLVRNSPVLDFADIEQIGLMLADKNPGEFGLFVEQIWQ